MFDGDIRRFPSRHRDEHGRFTWDWDDPFDPRNWERTLCPTPFCTLYLDDRACEFALVDADDYPDCVRWHWRANRDRSGLAYARRGDGEYLHRFIMRNTPQPSEVHFIVDHINGNRLDNRRRNLRWVTPSENAANQRGYYFKQYDLWNGKVA